MENRIQQTKGKLRETSTQSQYLDESGQLFVVELEKYGGKNFVLRQLSEIEKEE